MGREALPASEERAFEALAGSHANALIALHGHPDHEAVEGALIARGVSCARDCGDLAQALTDYWG